MTNQPEWTPGPWWYHRVNSYDPQVKSVMGAICDVGGYAGVNPANKHDEANARLIAAAPEMAPFVDLLASLPIGPNTPDDVPLYGLDGVYITHGHVRAARKVQAKARGETK